MLKNKEIKNYVKLEDYKYYVIQAANECPECGGVLMANGECFYCYIQDQS